MSDRHSSRFERLLETTARKVGGSSLHPVELLQRVQQAVEASRTEGKVANDIRIALNPADYDRFRVEIPRLKAQIGRLLDAREARDGLTRIAGRRISFEASAGVVAGLPQVSARFANFVRLDGGAPAGATRRLSRHSGVDLVFEDGSRVPLTHTPFGVGRATDNDLVLVDLTVSVHHAEIVASGNGFAIRDLGSRNGLIVDGNVVDRAGLTPGVAMKLGNTVLRLEKAGE